MAASYRSSFIHYQFTSHCFTSLHRTKTNQNHQNINKNRTEKLTFDDHQASNTLHTLHLTINMNTNKTRHETSRGMIVVAAMILSLSCMVTVTDAWVTTTTTTKKTTTLSKSGRHPCPSVPRTNIALSSSTEQAGFLHGQSSCFLPLSQLDQDYYAPRIIQVCLCVCLCVMQYCSITI